MGGGGFQVKNRTVRQNKTWPCENAREEPKPGYAINMDQI